VTDPEQIPPKPPQPDPAAQKVQADAMIQAHKVQGDQQMQAAKLQGDQQMQRRGGAEGATGAGTGCRPMLTLPARRPRRN
jgi:hypothetical protein